MKATVISIILAVVFIGGAVLLTRGEGQGTGEPVNNVAVVDGKQIITINAKGGYLPRNTVAQANLPTALKISTKGTFDCSAAISIPSLGYRKNLPPNGDTLIDVPPQQPGTTLRGLCAMGMYNFTVQFN